MAVSSGVVLGIDRDEDVGVVCHQALDGIVHQPVEQRCTLKEMEAMGSVDHPRAALPSLPSGKARHHAPHWCVGVDEVVLLAVDNLLELAIGPDIAQREGAARKWHNELLVAILDLLLAHRGIMHFVPLLTQHPHEGPVELLEVGGV